MTNAKVVLVGGGHANVLALPYLRKHCQPILVSECAYAPYSGMLPGFIAGQYRRDDCFINLQRLANKNNARLIIGSAISIRDQRVELADGRNLEFDLLALNPGATQTPPFVAPDGCAVKPIAVFMRYLSEALITRDSAICVVGAGAGGVETALSLAHRFRRQKARVFLTGPEFLPGFPRAMRQRLRAVLSERNIDFVAGVACEYVNGKLLLEFAENKKWARADNVVFATEVCAPKWLRNTDLTLDKRGFACVNEYLQSTSNQSVYIVGDAASHAAPMPKSGVMAVRQGATLAHNLLAAAGFRRAPLRRWRANRDALYIVGIGDGCAVGCRNGITFAGAWVWQWKRYLDARFMRQFLR